MLCYYWCEQKNTATQNKCKDKFESVDTIKKLLSQVTEEMDMTSCKSYGKVTTKSINEDNQDAAATLKTSYLIVCCYIKIVN